MKKAKGFLSIIIAVILIATGLPLNSVFKVSASTNGHTQSEAVSWANAQVGYALDYDGVYGAQCVDLIKYYYVYLGNGSYATGNAVNYQTNSIPSGWKRIIVSSYSQLQPGDIAVWKANYSGLTNEYGHVGIITGVGSNYFESVEQNASIKLKTTKEKRYYIDPIYCVIRPDWSGNYSELPKNQWIWTQKTEVTVGEKVSFNFNATYASWYVVGIYHNGDLTIYNNGSSDWYTTSFSETGTYSVHVAIYNNVGHVDTEEIVINVYEKYNQLPKDQWIWSNKTEVTVGEKVSFNFNATYASWYVVGIYHNGDLTIYNNKSSDWYTTSFSEPGTYSVHAAIYNNVGHVDTEEIIITVFSKNSHYLDVNGKLDDKSMGNLGDYGTFDVYIGGKLVANDVNDYYERLSYGSAYEIKDIKAKSGKIYNGVSSGSLKGTIGTSEVKIVLGFSTCNSHSFSSTITKTATCKETGIKKSTCSKCGYSKTETIAKNTSNHVGGTTVKNATTATCSATGYTGDTYCLGCNTKLSTGKTIDKTAHTDKNNDGYCDNCKAELTPHNPTNPTTPDSPSTPNKNCTCKCHSSGFSLFIWKIGNFFHRIFGMSKYRECPCGNKMHW